MPYQFLSSHDLSGQTERSNVLTVVNCYVVNRYKMLIIAEVYFTFMSDYVILLSFALRDS